LIKKKFTTPSLTPITLQSVYRRYVAHYNLALLISECKSQVFDSFREIHVHTYDFFKFVGVKVGVGQSIGIDENNTF